MKLIDHLGRLPADIYNKTAQAVDAVEWVFDSLSAVVPGAESFYRTNYVGESYGWQEVESDCNPRGKRYTAPILGSSASAFAGTGLDGKITITSYDPPTVIIDPWDESGNRVQIVSGPAAVTSGPAERWSWVGSTGSLYGFPQILATIPDGTEILEAKAQVHITGLSGSELIGNTCAGTLITKDISDMDISPIFAAVYPNGNFEPMSGVSVPPLSAGDNTVVVDCTQMLRDMYDLKYSDCLGFCTYIAPMGLSASLPGMPSIGYCGGDDPACDDIKVLSSYQLYLTWSNVSFGNVAIRLKYPDSERSRIITPHWPVLD